MPETVKTISDYVQLTANAIVILGALPIFIWFKKRSFEKKKKEISDNLSIRKAITDSLREHADGYDRSEPHDIGIRLVHWKNYPWKLDDGFKQNLYYDINLPKRVSHGVEFLTNTGILLEEHIWFLSKTIYLGKYGTHIIGDTGQKIKGFKEVKQRVKLIHTLKYKHIVNWDFEEKIEYEPVFYVKYKYTKRKLFEDEFFVVNSEQNYDEQDNSKGLYLHEPLLRRNRVKSTRSPRYIYLAVKTWYKHRKELRRRNKIQKKYSKRKHNQ